jgi:vacuolar-type H+-ATPase subunit C/Vma6
MNDSYSAARIQAMRTRLIKADDYERLLKMTEMEIIGYLQSTDYRQDVDALALKDLDNLETVDMILARNTQRTMDKLKRISSPGFMRAIENTLLENDAWNVQIVASAIAAGEDAKDMLKRYAKRGTFDPTQFAGAKTIEELCRLAGKQIPSLRRRPKTLAAFMDAVRPKRVDAMLTDEYLIDEDNIVRVLTMRHDRLPPERIAQRIERGGTIPRAVLLAAGQAQSAEEAMKALRTTKYGKALDRAQGSMVRLEYELHRDILRRLRSMAGTYPVSPGVIVRYLAEKDIEASNLRLIIKGKRLGLEEPLIREQLTV